VWTAFFNGNNGTASTDAAVSKGPFQGFTKNKKQKKKKRNVLGGVTIRSAIEVQVRRLPIAASLKKGSIAPPSGTTNHPLHCTLPRSLSAGGRHRDPEGRLRQAANEHAECRVGMGNARAPNSSSHPRIQ
jgi:hypothetical protein